LNKHAQTNEIPTYCTPLDARDYAVCPATRQLLTTPHHENAIHRHHTMFKKE
jgi:hypothetical protein